MAENKSLKWWLELLRAIIAAILGALGGAGYQLL